MLIRKKRLDRTMSSTPIKLMKNAVTIFDTALNARLAELDITGVQTILTAFFCDCEKENRSVCQRDIESEFMLSNPTVTGILKRMQSKGLIEKKPNGADRRSNTIHLTPKSRELQPLLANEMQHMEAVLMNNLSEQDRDDLIRILNIMIDNLLQFTEKGCVLDESPDETA